MFPCFSRLIRFPLITFVPGSMLHTMFSGRFDTKPSEDGSYFIDRDGTHFRYILNYLRTGQLSVPKDETIRVEVLAEAEFYQIQGIVNALRECFFKDSMILSLEQRQTLVNWLMETRPITIPNEKLLYRPSRDGWFSSNFHHFCDHKGPTVTVVKSGNYIFGGYTDQSWDRKSYIYTFTNRDLTTHNHRTEACLSSTLTNTKDKCCEVYNYEIIQIELRLWMKVEATPEKNWDGGYFFCTLY